MKRKGILLCLAINLSGCAAFNGGFDGLNGQSSFSCKAPDGILCDSMSGVMANLNANNLPSQQVKHGNSKEVIANTYMQRTRATKDNAMPVAPYADEPLLRQPKTLRIWVAPWESSDRTLFDQQYFYLVIDNWKWMIEHNSRRLQDAYAPIGAPISNYSSPAITVADPQSTKTGSDGPIPVNASVNSQPNSKEILNGINTEIKDLNVDISK
ncbi:type IV conjugative transfer system lipoprotein TraV, partial [Acinetobacter baumannii]